ncbi:MAG TPA: hypothetical protein VK826_12840 [Bacteroidia bacterium]|nr:hypothetical protein [Bacteroidia bacterium]
MTPDDSNNEISKEINSSSQFVETVKQYHNNINAQTLSLLEREYSFLDRLFGGKLIQAVTDQQLVQSKNEFALINRAHELKNEYTLDIIKQKCVANLTAMAAETNKALIIRVQENLNELQNQSRNAFKLEMIRLKESYEDVEAYKNDTNLYPAYKSFIDKTRDRLSRVTDKLLTKFEQDVDKIIDEFGRKK